MNKEDQSSYRKLLKYLKRKFSNIDDRTDIEQLILLLYCDLMIKHSSNPLAHYVDQLSKKNEINILNIHFDKNFSVTKTASHQRDFVEKLYGLMVFCIGPDYEGNFHLKENDQCKLDTGELYYNVEKQFFTDLCTAELISSVRFIEDQPTFISVFSLMI